MTAALSSQPAPGRALTVLAWGVTLLVSVVPEIGWAQLGFSPPGWLVYARLGLLLGLAICALLWKPLRPLRFYFTMLFAFLGLSELRPQFDFTWPGLQAFWGGSAFDARMQAEQTGKLVMTLLLLGVLFCLGFNRRDLFLALGRLRAPIHPAPLLGFPKPNAWPRFGLQWGLYIAAGLGAVQWLALRPGPQDALRLVSVLPSVLFYAALNAFNEEMFYRAPQLATLEPVCGSRQALGISIFLFGIAHYFGTPGGLLGALASMFMGWILGKAMSETRGLFWAWWIHFLSDVVIFSFMALALTA